MEGMTMNAPSNGSPDAMMMMGSTFYWGLHVQLLFSAWTTRSLGSYILSLAAIFILALFHVWFGELKKSLFHLSSSPSPSSTPPNANPKPSRSKFATSFNNFLVAILHQPVTRVVLLTVTHMLSVASGYLLMLIVMSFNVGVFLSVLAGLSFGFILFET